MQLTIDNLDGLGPVDYTAAIDASQPFEIVRTLNAPTILKGTLCLAASILPTPVRRGRVVVNSDAGSTLFTGYLTIEPAALYAGESSAGAAYRLALTAVSDEWLLDKQSWGSTVGAGVFQSGNNLFTTLLQRISPNVLTASGSLANPAGIFEPEQGSPWSRNAGLLANSTYSAYRAINGAVGLGSLALVQHTLSDGDGSLEVASLKTASLKELANDVTVSGALEPAAYWTELFAGDGTTAVFNLLGEPEAPTAAHATLIDEPFTESTLNLQQWQLNDPGTHISLTSAGLNVTGGNGLDGQTTLASWDPLEVGGTLVLELDTVTFGPGSAGILGGLYNGPIEQANGFAGFNIRQSSGNTITTPMVNGVEVGTSLTLTPGHTYTLRLRLHCPELLRVQQSFYALADTSGGVSVQQFGGGNNLAPCSLVFEARDQAADSNTPATILYDGTLASSPVQVTVVPINSLSLSGSIGSLTLSRPGTCWIRSTSSSGSSTGTQWTRLIGKASEGADCSVATSASGHVTFFAGRVPVAGETIAVSYRGRRRSIARVADPASLASEAAGGAIGTARWLGHVVQPPARSSADCEAAAQAILSFAANRAASLSGSYDAVNPATVDIWPGDLLSLDLQGQTQNCMIRRVSVSQQGACPEALTYRIAFANDWAEGLGLKLSEAIEPDALLPTAALNLIDSTTATTLPAHTLANLAQITITPASSTSLTIDAGTAPPTGGGFEVRRRDGGFGSLTTASTSGDLVLRSPVRGFSLPIAAADETFFIRMYDASTPPLYSRFSAAILNHQPGS
jgi:hypothetical protein